MKQKIAHKKDRSLAYQYFSTSVSTFLYKNKAKDDILLYFHCIGVIFLEPRNFACSSELFVNSNK